MSEFALHLGDCIDVMRTMPDNSVDSIVTDPPYGIRFMGAAWDGADIEKRTEDRRHFESHAPDTGPNGGHKSIAAEAAKYNLTPKAMLAFQMFSQAWSIETLRVLKPGGHLLSFSSPRTFHRMVCGIEDAGFEIRDTIMWIHGSGFPKSHNLDGDHKGYGTALKPAHEPICMARKPLSEKTVLANMVKWGVGAINIDGCRVGDESTQPHTLKVMSSKGAEGGAFGNQGHAYQVRDDPINTGSIVGRWPANIIHDGSDEIMERFAMFGEHKAGASRTGEEPSEKTKNTYGVFGKIQFKSHADSGTVARFFYCAKASRSDRNSGMVDPGPQFNHGTTLRNVQNTTVAGNTHPTVKPTDLMAYLCRLVTPVGGTILDPFTGSGSTGKAAVREGFNFIGIDMMAEYIDIARARIQHEIDLVAASVSPQFNLFSEDAA